MYSNVAICLLTLPSDPRSIAVGVLHGASCQLSGHFSWSLQAKVRPPLLAMLGDADSEVQGQALAFWHSALPRTLSARLAALLSDSLDDASTWVGTLLPATLDIEQGVVSIHTHLSLLSRCAPKMQTIHEIGKITAICSMVAGCPVILSRVQDCMSCSFNGCDQHRLTAVENRKTSLWWLPSV